MKQLWKCVLVKWQPGILVVVFVFAKSLCLAGRIQNCISCFVAYSDKNDIDIHNVADSDLPCERISVTATADYRKVIEEIIQAAPDGILLSELPQKFEVI